MSGKVTREELDDLKRQALEKIRSCPETQRKLAQQVKEIDVRRNGTGKLLQRFGFAVLLMFAGCGANRDAVIEAADKFEVYRAGVVPHPSYGPEEQAEIAKLEATIAALLRESVQ